MMRVRPLDLKFLNELAAMMRARRGEMRVPGVRGLRPWRWLGAPAAAQQPGDLFSSSSIRAKIES